MRSPKAIRGAFQLAVFDLIMTAKGRKVSHANGLANRRVVIFQARILISSVLVVV